MLSKEVKRRIKTKRVLRILRHATKLVKKNPPDLNAMTRVLAQIHRGKESSMADLLDSLPTEGKDNAAPIS